MPNPDRHKMKVAILVRLSPTAKADICRAVDIVNRRARPRRPQLNVSAFVLLAARNAARRVMNGHYETRSSDERKALVRRLKRDIAPPSPER
jgi:hypothetical protein